MKDKLYTLTTAFLLIAAIGWQGSALAGIVNGNFNDRFNGWQREVIDVSTNSLTMVTQPDFIFHHNFQNLAPNGAILQTSSTDAAPHDYWSASISQEFIFDTVLNPGEKLLLHVNVSSCLSDAITDFAFAQLEDLSVSSLPTVDLLTDSTFDITPWAGRTAKLSFGVQDSDDIQDSIVISNVGVEVAAVPVPNAAILMLTGLGLIARRAIRVGEKA